MAPEAVSTNRSFGGTQGVYRHASAQTGTPMVFSAFVPPQAAERRCPVVWYLSGLTCSHLNVTEKGEYRRVCSELGLIFIAPDTSPRGQDVPGDPEGAYDFGLGAGFYVDAREPPYDKNYRMYSYIIDELPRLIRENFPVDMSRQAIMGHSMGGHGALTIALKNSGAFRSVSAFAPISSPMNCAWGQKAIAGYLGADRTRWRAYDTTALIEDGCRVREILVDQGTNDSFLDSQLKPDLLRQACTKASIPLTLRMHEGYDHSYYFVSTFMEDHLRWHAARLND